MQAILTGVEHRDNVVRHFAAGAKFECVKQWDGHSLVAIMGNLVGCDEIQKTCRKEGKPYIYIDHGYFRRGYQKGVFRFCANNFHCQDWRDSDRKFWPKLKDWKREGKNVIVIWPPEKVIEIHNGRKWTEEAIKTIKEHTDRKIIIKVKGQGDFAKLLPDAHCVVSFGSVGDVEAAMAGVPVFCSPQSPAAMIGETDMTKIEMPRYPDREPWLRALSAAEWHLSEMKECWERLWPLVHTQTCNPP